MSRRLERIDPAEVADNPRCALCGAPMAVYRLQGATTVWRCDGAIGFTKWGGAVLAEGRWPDDPHAVRSELRTARG